ncbi:hypothetical protein Y1Q_0017203 [Alligator mississippiensis]|uniref:Uncharacterized protein n=1 Tax=Alligator mississippiensis TaxID=8496 RepID=A0A151NKQ8_ALLMI|nr:hypothetical protein Y1Q_0017203 [Alligator mississippiensis]
MFENVMLYSQHKQDSPMHPLLLADSTLLHCSNKIRLTSFSGEDPCFPPVSNSLKYKTGITYHKKIIHSTPNQDNHFNHAPNTQQNV